MEILLIPINLLIKKSSQPEDKYIKLVAIYKDLQIIPKYYSLQSYNTFLFALGTK
jgi:hypothetical protein